MRIRSSLLFLAITVVLVVGITWWRSRATPVVADTPPAQAVVASPRPEPRTIRAPSVAFPRDATRARRQVGEHRARQRASIDRVVAAGRNKIVGKYESEAIDSAWSNATRQALMSPALTASDQIRATHSEPSGLAIDCRSTTCRIGADFANSSAADDWSTLYLTGVGDRLPNASLRKTPNADGSVHVEIYAIARR